MAKATSEQVEDLQKKLKEATGMFSEPMKRMNERMEALKSINFNMLKPKNQKTINGNKVTLTEGAFVFVQFKTFADAEKYFDSL